VSMPEAAPPSFWSIPNHGSAAISKPLPAVASIVTVEPDTSCPAASDSPGCNTMRMSPWRISKSQRPSKFLTVSVTVWATPLVASVLPLGLVPEPLELELDEPDDEDVGVGVHPDSELAPSLLLRLALELELDEPDTEDTASGPPPESEVPFPMMAPPHPTHSAKTAPIPMAAAR
jgi:hypothetical protein